MIDRSQWLPLSPAFTAAIRDYDRASRARLLARDARDAVTSPLYHYTDAGGLKGILTNQQVWFTHWQHLNDPTEMQFGMDVAKAVLAEVGTRLGPKIKIFCDMVDDLFSSENMRSTFELYVASFSRARDDLNQWRVYAAKGQGFALSLASSLFGIEDKRDRRPHEHVFVAARELTKRPPGTHKRTEQERYGPSAAEIRQKMCRDPSASLMAGCRESVISVRLGELPKQASLPAIFSTTNPVGMEQRAETPWMRFSAHAGRLYARVDRRRSSGAGPAA